MTHENCVEFFVAVNAIIFLVALHEKWQFSKQVKNDVNVVLKKLLTGKPDEIGTIVILEHFKNSFKAIGNLKVGWNSFENGLVTTNQVTQEPIHASRESSEFLNIETLMESSHSVVSFSIWNAVPQILTSFGIIGTFASILVNLKGLGQSEHISESFIIELVGALASAFTSSLTGIFLAVLFIIIEKWTTKLTNSRLAKLNRVISNSFPLLTAEAILVQHTHLLNNLSAEITSSISKGFSEMTGGMGSALAEVLDDETKRIIKDGVANSFIEMNAILTDIRNESKLLTGELGELRLAKKEMFENIKLLTDEQNKIQAEINVQGTNLVENLRAFEKTIAPLAEVAKQVQATNELSDRLILAVKNVSDASSQIASTILKSEEISNSTVAKFNEQIGKVSAEYAGLITNIENWVNQSNSSLENNLSEFDKNIGGVLRQVIMLSNSFNTSVLSLERTVGKLNVSEAS